MMTSVELDLVLTFIESHPRAAARELELQPLAVAVDLMQVLPLREASQVFLSMLPSYSARVSTELTTDLTIGLIADSDINQVTSILRCLPQVNRNILLKGMPERTSRVCRLLLSYSEDIVGAWMSADMIVLPSDCSAGDALKRLCVKDTIADSNVLPVVDSEQNLLGLVNARDLLRAKSGTPINSLINKSPPVLSSRASLASIAKHNGWQHYDTLIVLNRNRKVVGILRHVDLRHGLERFGEKKDVFQHDGPIEHLGQAYVGTLNALLSLVGGHTAPTNIFEESR